MEADTQVRTSAGDGRCVLEAALRVPLNFLYFGSSFQDLTQHTSCVHLQMEAETQVRQSVGNSRRVLEEAFQTGTAILGSMSGQRDRLKVHLAEDIQSRTLASPAYICPGEDSALCTTKF